jgi:predicted RNase H-like nuclease/catechol 2,3-dioxygenase-like lactoylglutathione lyase family enzyme
VSEFVGIVLRVRDLERSARFYDALGVPFEREPAPGEPQLGLALSSAAPGEATTRTRLHVAVADLEEAHQRAVAAGAEVEQAPRAEGSHRTAAYLDPDGNVVVLSQTVRGLRVAGVDMAGGGWAVVVLEGSRVVDAFRCEAFADVLLVEAEVVAVDIPIGIPDHGSRSADAAARRFVGPRASSVFTTPIKRVLEAATYAEARERAVALTGKSISAQSYALRRRILEVDEYVRLDERLIEVHPEVSFRELARRPLPPKKRLDGLVERRRALAEAGIAVPDAAPRVREPDLLDATVAAWTAARYARGEALPLPEGHAERIGAIWR